MKQVKNVAVILAGGRGTRSGFSKPKQMMKLAGRPVLEHVARAFQTNAAIPGMMSFPIPGATLTLDFPNRGARTERLLSELDAIAIEAGGRVNPYKDARMSPATFEASFPHWRDFARHIDPGFSSTFWRRVTAG